MGPEWVFTVSRSVSFALIRFYGYCFYGFVSVCTCCLYGWLVCFSVCKLDKARPHESQWERSWNQPISFGNSREKSSWEFNGNSKGKRQTHPGAISPRNRWKNSPRFQTDWAQTESTKDGHETPPENPLTELNTISTPNTPDHSSIQQTPADETPQVPESAVLVVCHSSEEHQISSDILNVSSQTPVHQLLGDLIEKGIARKFYLSIIIERHIRIKGFFWLWEPISL